MRKGIAVAVVFAFACSSSPSSKTTPTGKGSVRQYKPLEMKADVKAKSQAVILGTDSRGGSTVIPLVDGTASAKVDSMWVRLGGGADGSATGGTSPVTLTASPNTDGEVRVGVYEQFSGGLGPEWRAGVWLSSFIAATTLGKDLIDFKFSADAGGHVDGASASGLMTAGFLAALTGATIDPKATMTGIINPDGTIGPVMGIPEKFLGSIEKGKTKLGFPIGLRYATDVDTRERVDLIALAKEKGVTAVEVGDVYDAYQLLTGKTLPRPVPVDEAAMAVDDDVNKAIEARIETWQKQLGAEWERVLELHASGRLPPTLRNLAMRAQTEATAGERLKNQGLAGPAYNRMATAWVYVAGATSTADVLDLVRANDIPGALAKLDEFAALTNTAEAALKQIGGMKPDTMGGHLQMISAFQKALVGWGFHVFAGERMGMARSTVAALMGAPAQKLLSDEVAEEVVNAVAPAVLAIGRGTAGASVALDALEIEKERGVNYLCSLPNLKRLAMSFHSASSANIAYFDVLGGVRDDFTRMRLLTAEPDYLVAWMTAHLPDMRGLPEQLKKEWGEKSLAWNLASLAGSELSYFKASLLIGRAFSLGVQNDPLTGMPQSVEHDKAFIHMLTSAERKAREHARTAKIATGSIPIQARLAYQNARLLREGDLSDKLSALEAFWSSSAYSQTATMLARN
jgi:hypothetical protein